MIGLLHRGAGLLDILRALVRTEEGIDRSLDLDLRQIVRALDTILVDIETGFRCCRLGRLRLTLGRLGVCGRSSSGLRRSRLARVGLGFRRGRLRADRADDQAADGETRGTCRIRPTTPHSAQRRRRMTARAIMIQTTRIHLSLDIMLALQTPFGDRSVLRTARNRPRRRSARALSDRRCARRRSENFFTMLATPLNRSCDDFTQHNATITRCLLLDNSSSHYRCAALLPSGHKLGTE
ncbi:hypothetical protein ACVW0J_007950 [Bradyrhizobium sp. i1.7.7]